VTGDAPARQVHAANDHVHQRIGTHFIDELSFGPVPPAGGEQPSRLLDAGNRVVRFTGRQAELAGLAAWRDSGTAVAVRLLHGAAGQGKTRLAHRFAEFSRASGWITLRARHSRDVAMRPVDVPAGNALVAAGRLLVVVDYAERWPLSDLLALLLDRRLHGSPALRVLLLARPVGNWWHALTHRLSQALGVQTDTAELAALGATPGDSRRTYEVARACFAEALRVGNPGGSPPGLEGSVLTIHMAALAHVLAVRHGDTPPTDPAQLSAYLLARERSHWQSMYDNDRRVESTPQVMGRAVYVAALTRPLDYAAAVVALKSAGLADSNTAAGRLLDEHAMCYPPHDPATVLEPLYPDRLAEDFVALQTPGHAVGGFRPDPWAAEALGALLGDDAGSVRTMLVPLIEAARRWPHLTESHLVPLLRRRPELVVLGGSPALSALAASPAVPLDLLAAIESALPADPPADLSAGLAAITERLAADFPGDPARAAARDLKLGWRLLNSGRVAEGIGLLARSVATTRRLAKSDHAGHAPQLELALRSLGRAHLQAKDWGAAAAALGEAVGLWTDDRARVRPPAPEIAGCLADLSLALWHQGDDRSSLATRHRAIGQLRRLVAADPRHRRTLIRALIQQADQLRRGTRHRDSLDALNEATELLREMAGGPDAVLEADFAAALLGRAKTLQSLGEVAEAEFSASGAVRVFGELAGRNVSFDRDLAEALGVQATLLARLDRWPEALGAQGAMVSIYRRLNRMNTGRYGFDLARALITFARQCRDRATRYQDGLDALAEAVALLLAGRVEPAARARLLRAARTLGADLLDAAGRPAEAGALRKAARDRPSEARSPG
jgi:hypothetical protein